MHNPPRFMRGRAFGTAVLVAATLTVAPAGPVAEAEPTPGRLTGALPDGAEWVIDVPPAFNGTLLLYSHGLTFPGQDNPAVDAPDPATARALLDRGYALAGSSFGTGFAVQEALRDQSELLEVFAGRVRPPTRTIAWGTSLGGLISGELLERNPDRISGAVPMCGLMAGGAGVFNTYLDLMFVVRTLIAPSIVLTADPDPFGTVDTVLAALAQAQETPQGRARIALAAAMADMPGWAGAGSPRPDPNDYEAQELGQFQALQELVVILAVAVRSELEQRAGGNVSWNTGVNYTRQLNRSVDRAEVVALYRKSGADLVDDLRQLKQAPRIAADPAAVNYLRDVASLAGQLHGRPVLTLHTAGDTAVATENEQAYAGAVRRAGGSSALRQVFVERAGHCTFTPAEMVAAIQVLNERLVTGRFPSLRPAVLRERAASLGPELNSVVDNDTGEILPIPAGFDHYRPGVFLRVDRFRR